ncbi:MAG: polymer-forming cytoskeletal protein [Lachnospiraceae bacterium]|nr:polymer-forming cytoskeletal protein [Lachnospiraceae bacterium]
MGFFQSLKQDLSEAVGELIGEDETPEGVENTEGIDDAAEAVAADADAEDVDYDPEDIEEMTEEQEDTPAEEYEDELPEEPTEETEAIADGTGAEAAAMALFNSLSDGDGLPFPDDSNEVDLAEKLAEEAYKAEMQAVEDNGDEPDGDASGDISVEENEVSADADEAIASLGDIDLNKMLENIQGELNAVQEDNAPLEPVASDDMIDGQMSLEDMMAMAESLTGENKASAEDAAVAEADINDMSDDSVSESITAENNAEETIEQPSEDVNAGASETVESVFGEDASDLGAPAEAAEIASDESANADTAVEEISVEEISVTAENTAETLNTDPESGEAEALMTDSAEAADPEPAKEKKTKKTSRKKKAKVDVSADIGAEELAGRVFSDETAHLSDGMMIRGNIISDGNMEVAGEIDGNIDILGKLNVSGTINGNTKAGELYAEGAEINGNIECSGSVKVGQGAVIIGDVAGTSAVIAGAIKGNIDVHGPVILADSAIVMGDIRSASVQISNGAAVEGMCSQVYAEVSPKTFFKDLKKSKQ